MITLRHWKVCTATFKSPLVQAAQSPPASRGCCSGATSALNYHIRAQELAEHLAVLKIIFSAEHLLWEQVSRMRSTAGRKAEILKQEEPTCPGLKGFWLHLRWKQEGCTLTGLWLCVPWDLSVPSFISPYCCHVLLCCRLWAPLKWRKLWRGPEAEPTWDSISQKLPKDTKLLGQGPYWKHPRPMQTRPAEVALQTSPVGLQC